MIHIGEPFTKTEGDRAYLCADVKISDDTVNRYLNVTKTLTNCGWLTDVDYPPASWNEKGNLWFSVPIEYERYLCKERSNAFVIALFWYACVTNSDISFDVPISKKLYDNLTTQLIPSLTKDGYGEIKLDGPVDDKPVWHEDGVVSGMSCGVDSQYTLACYGSDDAPDGMKLTHLVYYGGSYPFPTSGEKPNLDQIYSNADEANNIVAKNADKIAAHHGLPFLYVDNNIDRNFYRGGYVYTAMYRYLASTLALEHLYKTYISSSSGHLNDVEISLFAPTQHYESLLTDSCRTESLSYINSDRALRTEKLRILADNKDAQDYLSVCFQIRKKADNCGECYGCWKTMVPLDIMGKLSSFGNSFDLDKYYTNRRKVFRELIDFSRRPEATSARDCVKQFVSLAEMESTEAAQQFLEEYKAQGED